jgi:hypothetical protein
MENRMKAAARSLPTGLSTRLRWVALLYLVANCNLLVAGAVIRNDVGVEVQTVEVHGEYALGSISLDGKPIETALEKGVFAFRNAASGQEVWLRASTLETVSPSKAVLSGAGEVGGARVQFRLQIEASPATKAVRLLYSFSTSRDLAGWQAVLEYHSAFAHSWKCHMYPWEEDSSQIQREPLTYIGIPSLFLYREDRAAGVLWGMDPNWDYLDPTTWTKDVGLYFIDGLVAPQFRIGKGELKGGFQYEVPMQLVLTNTADPDGMITDLMTNWIALNHYHPEPLQVRSNDEALKLLIDGRRKTKLWRPGQGYLLESGNEHTQFIYIGEQGLNAYFDYLLFEMTGDPLWRTRAFEQMDFICKGQNTNREDPNFGVIHTQFNVNLATPGGPGFNSVDRGWNPGYKPDLNAHLARYMLLVWQRVKDHEGIDRRDWYDSARQAIDWVIRQQNQDGGLPQRVEIKAMEARPELKDWIETALENRVQNQEGERSMSSASGRALPAIHDIYAITGEPRYQSFMEELEAYILRSVHDRFYYTGHHPDLPPFELEEASIWGICEYWLDRYEETNDKRFLDHAVAEAYLALTWWCPKQLSWVRNPTQGAASEQKHYPQYSVYSYQNRKPECLKRLYDKTGNALFKQLEDRVLQNIYWTQLPDGEYEGATHERIADPWLARGVQGEEKNFNSLGTVYLAEQSVDALLQVLESYRTGPAIYAGAGLTNRVYPGGVVFYSEDITGKQRTPLIVRPARGSVVVNVGSWTPEKMAWNESRSDATSTTDYEVQGLNAGATYLVSAGGRSQGEHIAGSDGKIRLALTGLPAHDCIFLVEPTRQQARNGR